MSKNGDSPRMERATWTSQSSRYRLAAQTCPSRAKSYYMFRFQTCKAEVRQSAA